MNDNFSITRFPNSAGLKRGPNMIRKVCRKCLEEKTHGFWLFDGESIKESVFICDDCLARAKKEVN